jgi:hypothetical protein
MAHREFKDDNGRWWTVWEVRPERRERRVGEERRKRPRPSPDRRREQLLLAVVRRELANGWLAFETKGERRRYSPIPEGWSDVPDDALRTIWNAAAVLAPKKRLIE